MTENSEASQIWKLAEQKLPRMKNVNVLGEIGRVLQFLSVHAPDIYSGYPVPDKTEQEVLQLVLDLNRKASELQVQVRFNFLAIGFEIGNFNFGWNVPLVPQLVRIKKPLNWATKDNFTRRAVAHSLELAFGRDLERSISKDISFNIGQLLFAAIFFGGLLERKWLEPFLAAVIQGNFYQHNGILWVEMVRKTVPTPTDADVTPDACYYTKRFFPDNFTLALLYRMLEHNQIPSGSFNPNPWKLLLAYLKTLSNVSATDLPGNLDEFLKLGLSRNLYLPGSMLAYATGKLKSTSLAIGPWLRCLSGKHIKVARAETMSDQLQPSAVPKITISKNYSIRRQEELFTRLLKDINPKEKRLSSKETADILERYLKTYKNEMSPALQLMIHWGRQLLSTRLSRLERRSKKEAVVTSTIRRYFRAINTPFLAAAEDQNLTSIDPLELELIYEQTIYDRKDDYMTPRCLLQFHGFMEAFFGFPPIESVELKGSTSLESNQNANLITLDVYSLVLRGLGWGKNTISRWQRLRIISWVICYRCGLRPSEVLNLRVIDFQLFGPNAFELVVRINPKSERGKRRIPGSLLMSKDECGLLLDYYHHRRREIGLFGDNYLLAHPEQKSGRLHDEDLYEPARSLLRGITGDDTLRLYHSRHTFNSSLQMQFMLRGNPPFNEADFLNLGVSVENDKQLREALMGNENRGRKDQHVQSILVGHSTPEVTNLYYNHLADVLLGTLVRKQRDRVPITLKAIMALGGLRQSRACELLVENGDHSLAPLVKNQAQKNADRLLHPLLEKTESLSLPKVSIAEYTKLPPWEDIVTDEAIKVLKRGESNWDVAYRLYESVRQLDGKRLRTASSIIRGIDNQLAKDDRRWRGPTYTSFTDLRSVLLFLTEVGLPDNSFILFHHPRRGQSAVEQATALTQWRERIDVPVGGWVSAEPANKTAPKKGVVEIRVINPECGANKSGKQPAMSRGFEVAIELIASALSLGDLGKA